LTVTRYFEEIPATLAELGVAEAPGTVLVYDEVLEGRFARFTAMFDRRYPVEAGEGLKDLSGFGRHAESVLALVGNASRADTTVVAAGGGTVGDFSGFMASVLKRGVRLVSVPTTWLAAIDSAHGGKTALNVGGVKNQIGTFHPASEVLVLKPMLFAVPEPEARAACGELLKMAMLTGGPLFEGAAAVDGFGPEEMWALLPGAVAAKEAVVAEDPREETGRRQVLNLGHTFGHALEAHHGISHGVAVGCGLRFAIEWSAHQNRLEQSQAEQLLAMIDDFPEFSRAALPDGIDSERLASLLDRDKKSLGPGRVQFVFLAAVGEPVLEAVSVSDVVEEAGRQGWL